MRTQKITLREPPNLRTEPERENYSSTSQYNKQEMGENGPGRFLRDFETFYLRTLSEDL
jgi:hypothetical protein